MLSPPETGTTSGGNSGDVGGAGKPLPPADAWPWRSARRSWQAGQPASLVRRQGRTRPLHPIYGGALLLSSYANIVNAFFR